MLFYSIYWAPTQFIKMIYGLVISWLYWLVGLWGGGREAVFSGSPVIDCSLRGYTAKLIRPLRLGHCIILLEGGNGCLCKCHDIRVQTEERCD